MIVKEFMLCDAKELVKIIHAEQKEGRSGCNLVEERV